MANLTFNASTEDKLKLQAKKLCSESQFNSIEWQLSQRGKLLSRGSDAIAGYALPHATPIYRIYSMTKPVVSLVAVQLIDDGKLALDDKLSQYIPAMANLQVLDSEGGLESLSTPITIEHLLTHTAGFSYDFLPECKVAEQYRAVQLSGDASRSLTEVIGMLTTLPLAAQPGQRWRYSVATDVLAHVLENITGLGLPELMHKRVFEPLGMDDTAFYVPKDKQQRLLPMFGSRELGQVMVESEEPNTLNALNVDASYPTNQGNEFYRGGHGLFSTMDDYVKFMQVLETGESERAGRFLSSDGFELLWRNRIRPDQQPLVLAHNVMGGYGWSLMGRVMLDPTQSVINSAVGEGGWAGAASTYFWVDRSNGIAGIAMGQYIGSTPHLGALMQHAAYGMFSQA